MGRRRKHHPAPPVRPAVDPRAAPATPAAPAPTASTALPQVHRALSRCAALLFPIGTWLYVYLWVEPPLRYYQSAPEFFLRADFLADHTRRPGGLLDYAAAWLAQMDCRAALGALVASLIVGATTAGAAVLLRRTRRFHPALPLVPGLLLLALASRYDLPFLPVGLGVVLAVWGTVLWQAWRPAHVVLHWAAFCAIAALTFYGAGPIPALLFVLLGAASEATSSSRPCPGPSSHRKEDSRPTSGAGTCQRVPGWAGWAAVLAGGASLLATTADTDRRVQLEIEWRAQQGRWEPALEAARRLRVRPAPTTRLAIHQSLCQTDRLTRDLFTFPQWQGADLFPSMREGLSICGPLSDTLLELGQVGLAEHLAHEALENIGERPHVLWQLARINVLQDRPRAARVFLNRMRQIPFQRAKAQQRLEALDADPTLAGELDIARVRSVQVTTDDAESGIDTESLLRQLLQSNRRNRMAFEYLMAHYLLTDRTEPLVQSLRTLDDFGIREMPRHLEEALLAHLSAKGDGTTEAAGRRASAGTVRRFAQFQNRLSQNGGRTAGIEMPLAREFGDTFWFYRLFGATFGSAPPGFTADSRP